MTGDEDSEPSAESPSGLSMSVHDLVMSTPSTLDFVQEPPTPSSPRLRGDDRVMSVCRSRAFVVDRLLCGVASTRPTGICPRPHFVPGSRKMGSTSAFATALRFIGRSTPTPL